MHVGCGQYISLYKTKPIFIQHYHENYIPYRPSGLNLTYVCELTNEEKAVGYTMLVWHVE